MTLPDLPIPLLMLPGTLCDRRAFGGFGQGLGHELLAADLTGFAAVDEAVEALLAKAPPRFILAGFSLGGIVALALARRAPQRVAAMVLIATNCRSVPPEHHAVRRAAVAGRNPAQLVGDDLWRSYVHSDRQADTVLRDLVIAMAEACPAGTAERQTELALSRTDSRPGLGGIAMPVLVLAGADDAVAPADMQRELAAGLPDGQLALVEGAGHFVLLEKPEACALVLAQWLEKLPQSSRSFALSPEVS